MYQLPRSKH